MMNNSSEIKRIESLMDAGFTLVESPCGEFYLTQPYDPKKPQPREKVSSTVARQVLSSLGVE